MSKGGSSCELSSLDSTRNNSTDNSQFYPKLKGSIIEFKTKTKVIAQIVYFISFILIVNAIACPWLTTRSDAINCFNKLFEIGMPNITDFLARLISGHLNEYQMVTNYLASLYEVPAIISVDDQSVFELIKFSISTYNFSLIKPVVIFACKPGEIFYQVFFAGQDFDFYVQYYEGDRTINKKYPSKYKYETFDHNIGGVIVDSIPGFQDTLIYEQNRWANIIMRFNDSSTSVFTYSLSNPNKSFKVGLAFDIQSLMSIFKSGIPNSNFRYVFMTADGGVLFESKNGLKSPNYNTSHHKYNFPRLNELDSPFWTAVSKMNYSNFQNIITFNEMTYLTRYSYIESSNEVTYAFLLVIEKDQLLSVPLYRSAIFFVVLIAIIAFILLLSKFIQRKNKERCKNKLNLRDASLFPQSDDIESYSTLQHCITQIRTLELMYPEESSLNHTLDKIVQTLTDICPLSNHIKKDNDSLLFSNLNNSRKVTTFTNENCFHHWRSMIKNALNSKEAEIDENSNINSTLSTNLIFNDNLDSVHYSKEIDTGINFSIDECSLNPPQYLMKTFMKIIFDESILFQIFDPDIFLQFIFNFSTSLCVDCISSSFLLTQLHHIINKYFFNWFNNKFDLLIIYFTSIIYFTKMPDSELEEEEEDSNDNNNNNNNDDDDDDKDSKSESTSNSKNHKKNKNRKKRKNSIKKINDENGNNNNNEDKISDLLKMPNSYKKETKLLDSKSERKFQFIMKHFIKYFDGIQENDMFISFQKSVKQIFHLIQDFKMFQLLGKFRVRIESPDFSIFNDINDKYLFIASLIKFCQFGLYYQEMEMMHFLVQDVNNVVFTQAERENRLLLADFHFECSSKLATYWLNCFTQFVPMKNEKMNLINNTSFWASEKSTMFQEYL